MNKPKSDKEELDPAKTEVLDKIADFILKKDLDVLAVMTIESMRPLHFLGSQAMLFFEPFLGRFIGLGVASSRPPCARASLQAQCVLH